MVKRADSTRLARPHPDRDFGRRVQDIVGNAEKYHEQFCKANKFTGPSLHFHQRALAAREQGDFERLVEYIYATLASWGMHRMGKGGAKLKDFETFRTNLRGVRKQVERLARRQPTDLTSEDWAVLHDIFGKLEVMKSGTRLVGNSKVLAHLLPNLIAPIDRRHTLRFLDVSLRNDPVYEYYLLKQIHVGFFHGVAGNQSFARLAQQWKDDPDNEWDTSVLKVVDNLVVGRMA